MNRKIKSDIRPNSKAKTKTKPKSKVKPNSRIKSDIKPQNNKDSDILSVLPFHETFPITLTYKKDKENKVCYFECEEHLKSYLTRYKLTKSSYTISKTKPRETSKDE